MKKKYYFVIPVVIGVILVIAGITTIVNADPFEQGEVFALGIFMSFSGVSAFLVGTLLTVAKQFENSNTNVGQIKSIVDNVKTMQEELKNSGVIDENGSVSMFDSKQSKAKYCQYCGSKLNNDESCSNCGAKVTKEK